MYFAFSGRGRFCLAQEVKLSLSLSFEGLENVRGAANRHVALVGLLWAFGLHSDVVLS